MMNTAIILTILTTTSVIVAYILVFKPEKDFRFEHIINRINILLRQTLLIVTLLVGAIPSILVIQDRWLGYKIGLRPVDFIWWDNLLSVPLVYPRYFLIIFLLTALTWLIVFFWQNNPKTVSALDIRQITKSLTENNLHQKSTLQGNWIIGCALGIAAISAGIAALTGRIPGWELILALGIYIFGWTIKEYDARGLKPYLQNNGILWLNTSAFIISLCGVLYATFGESHDVLVLYVLFALSAVNLYKYRKYLPTIFWIIGLSLIALTWKINGWEYVVIGDEYSFYTGIREILENRTLWELINTTFYGNFVYGTHPYFSSYIHNFFMKMFGNHNFGWRFSNPFLVSTSLYFYFYFFKSFTTKRTALTTVILLGFSHYLLSFSKIGYNNLQAFFALGVVLAMFAWALKSMRLSSFSFLGLAMGFCFYIYPAALYILPLPIIGMLIYLLPINQYAVKRWGWTILSTLLLIYPLFIQPKYWEEKIPGTFLYTQAGAPTPALIQNITINLIYSLFSYLYTPNETHYVSTAYMDPLSGIFVVMGVAILARMLITRNKSSFFLTLCFLAVLIPVGLTHGRPFPTTTRMFLLLPWLTLFAALGIEWLIDKSSSLFSVNSKKLLGIIIAGIVIINMYNAYIIDIDRSVQYHTVPSIFIKTVRQINENRNIQPKSYYFVAEEGWNTSNMIFHQWVYLVPASPRQIVSLFLEKDQLPLSMKTTISERDTVTIVRSSIDAEIIKRVDIQLQTWGKSMCEIKNEQGTIQFQLWHSGDLGWLCE